jgi:ABC-type multidrug transport system fused ATPase/permease subunit
MRALFAILTRVRPWLRAGITRRLVLLVALSSVAGATAGVLPAILGSALNAVLGRSNPIDRGLASAFALLVTGLSPWGVILAAFAATLATVAVSVYASRHGSELSGYVTAALRITMLRAVLSASPRDVEAAGAATIAAKGGPVAPQAPPGAEARAGSRVGRSAAEPSAARYPGVRGGEIVKLAIARESGMVADFAIALLGGLPQAVVTLAVLAFELIEGGTAVVLAGGAALFVLSRIVADRASRRVGREMMAMQTADAAIFASLGEMLAASEDLRLLGARRAAILEFAAAAYRVAAARRRFTAALAISAQIKSVFSAVSPLLILVALHLSGRASDAGEVAKLMLLLPLLFARFEALDALRAGLIEREPLLRATLFLLDLPEAPRAFHDAVAAEAVLPAHGGGAIAFTDVSFTPPGASAKLLDALSFSIPAGALVGICGRSGSGKSTLLRLLLRLDDPSAGSITLDGVDLRRLRPDDLPRIFSVLGQTSRLFERSVAENLALGLDPPPSLDRMRDALRRVDLGGLAAAPTEGSGARDLTTEVRAVPPNFSGGEQRRLLLARMLLRDARLFVLDEPEAGLPGATAEQILRRIVELARGRTCVVATHAPHLLRSTFNVLIDAGRVVAIGTHEELVARSDIYRSLLADALKEPSREPPAV